MINNGHIGLHCLRNLKRKANEATNNFSGTAAGIGGSVCVNYLCPVEAGGGGMKDEALKLASALDHWATQMDMGRKPDPKSLIRKTSVELRRLQAELDATKQALAAPVQPGRNHYEDGDVFERIAAKKKPAAQPAPVQELQRYSPDGEGGMELDSLGAYIKLQDVAAPPNHYIYECARCGKSIFATLKEKQA